MPNVEHLGVKATKVLQGTPSAIRCIEGSTKKGSCQHKSLLLEDEDWRHQVIPSYEMEVFSLNEDPIWTGLLDQNGNYLFKPKEKVGFLP